jgi:hypothetical protein
MKDGQLDQDYKDRCFSSHLNTKKKTKKLRFSLQVKENPYAIHEGK